MKRITFKDIAAASNVTVSTVSHVFNDRDDISEQTKKKVLDTAKKLGYIVNTPAVALRSGKTKTVAIIIPDISNPHISNQIKLIQDELYKNGYSTMIFNSDESADIERNVIITAFSNKVDGILLCPTQQSIDNLDLLKNTGVPCVLMGRYFKNYDMDYVCPNDLKGGYIAGQYLLNKGLKSPVYFGTYDYIEGSQNRFDGLVKAFSEKNIVIDSSHHIRLDPRGTDIAVMVEELYNSDVKFDSIVAFSDLIAYKILFEIKNHFKNFELPIVSFDATQRHLFNPSRIVSVGMKGDGWSTKAAAVILDKMLGKHGIHKELIDVELFEY